MKAQMDINGAGRRDFHKPPRKAQAQHGARSPTATEVTAQPRCPTEVSDKVEVVTTTETPALARQNRWLDHQHQRKPPLRADGPERERCGRNRYLHTPALHAVIEGTDAGFTSGSRKERIQSPWAIPVIRRSRPCFRREPALASLPGPPGASAALDTLVTARAITSLLSEGTAAGFTPGCIVSHRPRTPAALRLSTHSTEEFPPTSRNGASAPERAAPPAPAGGSSRSRRTPP